MTDVNPNYLIKPAFWGADNFGYDQILNDSKAILRQIRKDGTTSTTLIVDKIERLCLPAYNFNGSPENEQNGLVF